MSELRNYMKEALNLVLDEPEKSKIILPMRRKKITGKHIVKVRPDPGIAFAMILRQFRLNKGLTQRQMAQKLNRALSQYQKLEKSKTANPNLKTMTKLKDIFPDLPMVNLF